MKQHLDGAEKGASAAGAEAREPLGESSSLGCEELALQWRAAFTESRELALQSLIEPLERLLLGAFTLGAFHGVVAHQRDRLARGDGGELRVAAPGG